VTAQYHLFEVAWDVADPLDRAAETVARFGDRAVVVGPAARGGEKPIGPFAFEPERGHGGFEEGCREAGLSVRVGRWGVPGRTLGLLVDAGALASRRDAVLSRLWRAHRIESLFAAPEHVDALLFGHAAGLAVARWWAEAAARHPGGAVLVAHGWRAGTGLLAVREVAPEIGTVFLLADTVLGGASSAEPKPDDDDGRETVAGGPRAEPLGLQAEHAVEVACAAAADVVATVGEPAAAEVERFLARRADAVLPLGAAVPPPDADPASARAAARDALVRGAVAALGRDLSRAAHVLVGAGDPKDPAFVGALSALAVLDRRPGRTVVAWVFAPGAVGALHTAVVDRLAGRAVTPKEEAASSTHYLRDPDGDLVEKRLRALALRPGASRRVLVVRVPVEPADGDGFLGRSRAGLLAGFDVAVHGGAGPAADRAALASLAAGVPVVSTDESALGSEAIESGTPSEAVAVVATASRPPEEALLDAATAIGAAVDPARDVAAASAAARAAAEASEWSKALPRHEDAWREALARAAERRTVAASPAPPPPALAPLARLAEDFAWTWDAEAAALFEEASPTAWRAARHAPVRFLRLLAARGGDGPWADAGFRARVEAALARRDAARSTASGPAARSTGSGPTGGDAPVAYFSAEFGLHESLPIYGGGLGVLAGDHLKAASDLGLPLVGVGLLYRRGRSRQRVGPSGEQRLVATWADPRDLALSPARDEAGRELEVEVPLFGRTVLARAWRARVGRVDLWLLDTDVDGNAPDDRTITHVLYPSESEARLRQELVLGRGGARLLARLGVAPRALHLNEGHPAFAALELAAARAREGASFEDAVAAVRAATTFTTHTPVPAGHDRFDEAAVLEAAPDLAGALGVDPQRWLALARDEGRFSMTRLAVSLSSTVNGVSRLHARVSRRLLAPAWPGVREEDVPVGHVTNGVHLPTWTHPDVARCLGVEGRAVTGRDFAEGAPRVDLAALWAARAPLRRRLLERIRAGLERTFVERRLSGTEYDRLREGLDERALWIGFARRFAGYKRATLLLSDAERLARLCSDRDRPVRFAFAGKSHPADGEGKAILAAVARAAREGPLSGRVYFVEDYGFALARVLVQGCDAWLNLPRRGLEASGTSGMKAAANGGLHVSVPDGWWAEAADGENGWNVGGPAALSGPPDEDASDAASLYDLLEKEVVPLFFHRDAAGVPWKWLSRVQHSLATIPPAFDAARMLREYAAKAYRIPVAAAPSRARAAS
jgi:phosphorylase/glycogen(starch) synthase